MSYILLSQGKVFIAAHEDTEQLEKIIEEWKVTAANTISENVGTYAKCFRKYLLIPEDATEEQEREIFHHLYGEKPFSNELLLNRAAEAQKAFDKLVGKFLNLHDYLVEHGCKVTEWDKVAYDCV